MVLLGRPSLDHPDLLGIHLDPFVHQDHRGTDLLDHPSYHLDRPDHLGIRQDHQDMVHLDLLGIHLDHPHLDLAGVRDLLGIHLDHLGIHLDRLHLGLAGVRGLLGVCQLDRLRLNPVRQFAEGEPPVLEFLLALEPG